MAASTSAKQEPAQPSSTNIPLPMDSKNDFVANDESAPLLDADDMAPSTRDASTKLIYIFTSTALSSSALTLISIIATIIAVKVGENHYWLPWGVVESMVSIIAPAKFSLVFSSLAGLRNGLGVAPLAVNMLCDILVAVFAISYGATGLCAMNHGPLIPAKVLAGIALASGTICGIAHLGLFALRCSVAYRSKIWKHPWNLPNGQLTLDFSVKFYKEPQRSRDRAEDAV